jgi:tRNA-2-methylthio-N6-dimethylallyladenosine synthase
VNTFGRDVTVPGSARRPLFAELLRAVGAVPGIRRVRFTSPHPHDFTPDVIDAMAETPTVCEHIHFPLQSGSDRVLKVMQRSYRRERYLGWLDAIRAAILDIAVSTDVIVGFPGETGEDFAQTRELFEAVNYDMAYIFKYSVRTGTPAADLPGQVPDEAKEERNQILLRLLEKNSRRRNQALVGSVQEVLVEGPDKKGLRSMGRTRGNRTVHFEAAAHLVGRLLPVQIERATTCALYGGLVSTGKQPGPADVCSEMLFPSPPSCVPLIDP